MMLIEDHNGERKICGEAMVKPPPGSQYLRCCRSPGHVDQVLPNGRVDNVHVARCAGGGQLGAWRDGD